MKNRTISKIKQYKEEYSIIANNYYNLIAKYDFTKTDVSKVLNKKHFLISNPTIRCYLDPDGVLSKNAKIDEKTIKYIHYSLITKFLNIREKEFAKKNKLNGQYIYLPPYNEHNNFDNFIPNEFGISNDDYISIKNANIKLDNSLITVVDKKTYSKKFLLKTDQFGFSANPNNIFFKSRLSKYPLSIIVTNRLFNRKFIVNYLTTTRSIGGVFIWPKFEHNNDYNYKRGFLEDRVDKALLELSHFYTYNKDFEHSTYVNDELYKCLIHDTKHNITEWLNHFDDFDVYSEFFMFDIGKFVIKNKGVYKPISIIKGEILEDSSKKNTSKIKLTNFNPYFIKKTLCNLQKNIKKRNDSMYKYIIK